MIFSIANFKGGVGKTTTAVSLAHGLFMKGYKVLLIDSDPQQNSNYAFQVMEDPEPSLFHLYGLKARKPGYESYQVSEALITAKDQPDLLPSGKLLSNVDADFSSANRKEEILKRILKDIRDQYDIIIIDCPPALGLLTKNALTVSDYVIIPCTLEFLPVKGILEFINQMGEFIEDMGIDDQLSIAGILLNQFNENPILSRQLNKSLHADFEGLIFDSVIRKNIALSEAQLTGASIFSYAPESNGAKDFLNFTDEIERKFLNNG